jgi:hypothetical protein
MHNQSFDKEDSLIKIDVGRFSGIRHLSLIGVLPVVDGNEIDNLLLLIR